MSCRQMGHSRWSQRTLSLVEHSEHTGWLQRPTEKILVWLRQMGQSSALSEYTRWRAAAAAADWSLCAVAWGSPW